MSNKHFQFLSTLESSPPNVVFSRKMYLKKRSAYSRNLRPESAQTKDPSTRGVKANATRLGDVRPSLPPLTFLKNMRALSFTRKQLPRRTRTSLGAKESKKQTNRTHHVSLTERVNIVLDITGRVLLVLHARYCQ